VSFGIDPRARYAYSGPLSRGCPDTAGGIISTPRAPRWRRRPGVVLTATQHHAACRCQHGNNAAAAEQRNQLVCCAAAAGGPHAAGSMSCDRSGRFSLPCSRLFCVNPAVATRQPMTA